MEYRIAGGGKKKPPRIFKALAVIALIILALLYAIGATLGGDSEERQTIADSVAENRELKEELTAKDETINELQSKNQELEKEVEYLKEQLASIPTASPTPYEPQAEPSDETAENEEVSPRDEF